MVSDFEDLKGIDQVKSKIKKDDIIQKQLGNGKKVTVVNCDDEELTRDLRRYLNCGGVIKDSKMQFQGYQKQAIITYLKKVSRYDEVSL